MLPSKLGALVTGMFSSKAEEGMNEEKALEEFFNTMDKNGELTSPYTHGGGVGSSP